MFIRNVGICLQLHTMLLPRRPIQTSLSWSPQISYTVYMSCLFQMVKIRESFVRKVTGVQVWAALSLWAYYNKRGNAHCVRNGPCPFPPLRWSSPPVRLFPRGWTCGLNMVCDPVTIMFEASVDISAIILKLKTSLFVATFSDLPTYIYFFLTRQLWLVIQTLRCYKSFYSASTRNYNPLRRSTLK
jgi:hypothetical protein